VADPGRALAGAQYRRLPVDDLDQYEGISVFYAAAPLVTLLQRRGDLRETTSDYLVRELERYGVAVRDRSEIVALHGSEGHLEAVALKGGKNPRAALRAL
jgi:thioredoxin reductase